MTMRIKSSFILVNLAKNKPTSISSTWKSQTTSEKAVDGNSDHLIAGGSCAVTKTENNPWFQLDIQKSTTVAIGRLHMTSLLAIRRPSWFIQIYKSGSSQAVHS